MVARLRAIELNRLLDDNLSPTLPTLTIGDSEAKADCRL